MKRNTEYLIWYFIASAAKSVQELTVGDYVECEGRGRKRTRVQHKKELRKTSVSMGREYVKSTGEINRARKIKQNPCLHLKCKKHCKVISEVERNKIFSHYWSLANHQRQRDWIVRHVDVTEPKRISKKIRKNDRK